MHILGAGCMDFETSAPIVCKLFSTISYVLYSKKHMNKWPFLGSLHPSGAQNKSLISDTDVIYVCVDKGPVINYREGGGG